MTRQLVVTGAARGIGEAIARAAATDGYRVGLIDVDPLVCEVASSIPDAVAGVTSSADPDGVAAFLESFGGADVVVNNAGIVRFGPLLDQRLEDWRSVVEVNLTGTFVVSTAAARQWVASGRGGSIVNVTSMNGVMPGPNAGAYGSTKAAVALLTRQMALEWGAHGIRVNAVAPGLIDAGMSSPLYADPEIRAIRQGRVPLGRLGTADDIARAVLWLASAEADYVTGHELVVDGGVTMSVIAGLPRPASVDSVGTASLNGTQ